MDYLEKGKNLAQQGQYEEALDALYLALENDKENADIHFYLGLCYSAMEQFKYARYHYEIALAIEPNHQKTKLVWDGIKEFSPERPPETRHTRSAAAKEKRKQQLEEEETPTATQKESQEQEEAVHRSRSIGQYPVSDSKWEQAFPSDTLEKKKEDSFLLKFLIILLVLGVIAAIVFFVLNAVNV